MAMLRKTRDTLCSNWLFRRANAFVWFRLPKSALNSQVAKDYGEFLQRMVRLSCAREQNPRTYFLRNRPELELIGRVAQEKGQGASLKIAVLACSMGAEAYSILWKLNKLRPDLTLDLNALDISEEVLEIAKQGLFDVDAFQLERLIPEERKELFEEQGEGRLRVRQELRDAVQWHLLDATQPAVVKLLGPQDIVIANRFLCHMHPPMAEQTLRQIAQLVLPGGMLICSGVDVEVRTKVAQELGWEPIQDLLEEIHEGDHTLRDGWPWEYWALEPLNKKHSDWQLRYASAFRIGKAENTAS